MSTSSLNQLHAKVFASLHQVGDWLYVHLINIVIILVIAWLLKKISSRIIGDVLKHNVRGDLFPTKNDREKRYQTLKSMTNAVTQSIISIIAIILILGEINPNYANVLFASAGLLTVAIGFSAKDIINDFVKGVFIIIESQYRVGDSVKISGVDGVVQGINVRMTILKDGDGNTHYIPNGSISLATNKSLGVNKINEDLRLEFNTDIELAIHTIDHVGQEVAALPEFKNKIKTVPHVSQVVGFDKGAIVLRLSATTTASDTSILTSTLNTALHKAFIKNKIKISNK
jgi:small conductance mechanosensitive channel